MNVQGIRTKKDSFYYVNGRGRKNLFSINRDVPGYEQVTSIKLTNIGVRLVSPHGFEKMGTMMEIPYDKVDCILYQEEVFVPETHLPTAENTRGYTAPDFDEPSPED